MVIALIVGIVLLCLALALVLSYYADPEYWHKRVSEGGWNWQQFQDDIKHYEEKNKGKPLF